MTHYYIACSILIETLIMLNKGKINCTYGLLSPISNLPEGSGKTLPCMTQAEHKGNKRRGGWTRRRAVVTNVISKADINVSGQAAIQGGWLQSNLQFCPLKSPSQSLLSSVPRTWAACFQGLQISPGWRRKKENGP